MAKKGKQQQTQAPKNPQQSQGQAEETGANRQP